MGGSSANDLALASKVTCGVEKFTAAVLSRHCHKHSHDLWLEQLHEVQP